VRKSWERVGAARGSGSARVVCELPQPANSVGSCIAFSLPKEPFSRITFAASFRVFAGRQLPCILDGQGAKFTPAKPWRMIEFQI